MDYKLPDLGKKGVHASYWREAGADLMAVRGYLEAQYLNENDVSSEVFKGFKDGMAKLIGFMEGCLREVESQSSKKDAKTP